MVTAVVENKEECLKTTKLIDEDLIAK